MQYIWWGWAHSRWGLQRFSGNMGRTFRWRIFIGPIEIKRWA